MVHDLASLRQARAAAIALRSSGTKDRDVADAFRQQGLEPTLATIVLRELDVEKAEVLSARGRRDIHYGLLTAGSAAVIAIISSTLPALTVLFGSAILFGLAWMARGYFLRWRARRIAPRIYEDGITELFGGYRADMIKDPNEALADRAAFALSIKRARNNANYFSYIFTAGVFLALLRPMSSIDSEYAFLFLMGIAFAVFIAALFASYELLFRAENLPPPRLFSKARPVTTNEPLQHYAAPHFSNAPPGGDAAVLSAPAHDDLPPQSAMTKHKDELVFGVLFTTKQGIAFLPDIPVDHAELRAMGKVAVDLAANAHPALEALRDAVLGEGDEPETLPQWVQKSLGHPTHFVIAWSDLVETGHNPATGLTSIVKDDGAGSRENYSLDGLGNAIAVYLFNLKLRYERQRVVMAVVYQPMYDRLEAELLPHFRQLHGDAWKEHAGELHKAIIARMSSVDPTPEQEVQIRERLGPLLPALMSVPALTIKEGRIVVVDDAPADAVPQATA